MTGMRQIYEVARRDFAQRARSKAFLFLTLLTVGLIFAFVPLMASEIQDPPPSRVGVAGSVPDGFEERLGAVATELGFDVEVEVFASVESGERALTDGDVEALVVDGAVLEFATEPDSRIGGAVTAGIQSLQRDAAIGDLALTPDEAARIVSPPGVEEQILEPLAAEVWPRRIGAQIGAVLLYLAILIFGQFIMLGVMEEKQSRVVEVVLSRMRAERLLTGKILGIGLLGLIQLVVIGGALVGAVMLVDIPGLDLSRIGITILLQTTLWFLLGFAMYSVLYGALGATVTRQEDSQGAAMLPVILLLPGYFISFTTIDDPNSLVAVIGSIVPFSSPLVMPVRLATGAVPLWQSVLAIALIVVTTFVVIKLGARVYRGAVLSIGARVRIREALRSSGSRAA